MPPPSRKMEVLALLPGADVAKPGKHGTVEKLLTQIKLNSPSIGRYLRQLKDDGLAHIGRWNRTGGCPAPVWVQGKGEHAPMPAPRSNTEYCRKHRKKVAKAIDAARRGDKYDDRYGGQVALALADDLAKVTRKKPQGWASQLGL